MKAQGLTETAAIYFDYNTGTFRHPSIQVKYARLRYWMALSSPMTCPRMEPAGSPGRTSSSPSVVGWGEWIWRECVSEGRSID